jgi:hypothetical protein
LQISRIWFSTNNTQTQGCVRLYRQPQCGPTTVLRVGLALDKGTRPPKPSGIRRAIAATGDRINLVAGRKTIQAFEVTYKGFSESVYSNERRKAYLIPILDQPVGCRPGVL